MSWRDRVIAEALTWLNTPYHHMGRVKGAGTDCGMLLLEIFERTGLIPRVDVPYYPQDFAVHRGEELYLGWVKKYCDEINAPPLPGDIAVYQYGRCVSHAGIVLEWPVIIHAFIDLGVIKSDVNEVILKDAKGASRLRAIYRPRLGGD